MGRKLDVDELVGAADIAARCVALGLVSSPRRQVVHNWAKQYGDFPTPVLVVSQVSIWYWPEVEAWLQATDLAGARPERVKK